jgi:DNA-binding GntR family transcriptional regulator
MDPRGTSSIRKGAKDLPAAKPAVRRTSAEIIARRLRRAIQRGKLAPGARLRQVDIAQRFGASTTPVREAFVVLQAEGYVRIDPHRGAIVFEPSPEDLWEAYAIRESLECLALAKATERVRPDTIRELQRLIDEMRATNGSARWVKLNDRFHMTLYRQSAMPRLCALISGLRDASAAYMHMRAASHPAGERVDDEHAAILEAVARGDARRAQDVLQGHLRRAVQEITGFLEPPVGDDVQIARPGRAVASRR